MEFKEGWLERDFAAATATVAKWSPERRELMLCASGRFHKWDGIIQRSPVEEVRLCLNCGREQVRFAWARLVINEGWIDVRRGYEGTNKVVA